MMGPRKLKRKMVHLLCVLVILHSCKSNVFVSGEAKGSVKEGAGPTGKPVSAGDGGQSDSKLKEGVTSGRAQPEVDASFVGTLDDDDTVTNNVGSDTEDDVQMPEHAEDIHKSADSEKSDNIRDNKDSKPSDPPREDESVANGDVEEDEDEDEDEPSAFPIPIADTMNHIYKAMFSARRSQHKEALETIISMPDVEKQFKMVTMVLEKMHTVMTQHKVKLTESGYTPGDPFPDDQNLREGLSSVLENVALFGDLILRLPDMIENMLSRKREWDIILRWGVGVAQLTDIYDDKDKKMLHLVAQEMGITDKDPDYVNPYKDETRELRAKKEREMAEERKKEQKKKKRKEKKRGPRLSGGHTEL